MTSSITFGSYTPRMFDNPFMINHLKICKLQSIQTMITDDDYMLILLLIDVFIMQRTEYSFSNYWSLLSVLLIIMSTKFTIFFFQVCERSLVYQFGHATFHFGAILGQYNAMEWEFIPSFFNVTNPDWFFGYYLRSKWVDKVHKFNSISKMHIK